MLYRIILLKVTSRKSLDDICVSIMIDVLRMEF